ncbi:MULTISPECIES: hypothetical protein [unclassified Mesorhizobium]|uniref:hypothetical protein n=1 Tax=unclassified Mesorhizobium TaxID=325217 RepID=UPI003015399C
MAINSEICEVKARGEWVAVSIEDALRMLHPDRTKRCPECHGAVRAHSHSKDGMRAHFEHLIAHKGCSKSTAFDGQPSTHPKAIS